MDNVFFLFEIGLSLEGKAAFAQQMTDEVLFLNQLQNRQIRAVEQAETIDRHGIVTQTP